MTAFGKLIRTTAFRLTLVYLFLFALFAASLRQLRRDTDPGMENLT